MKTLSCIQNHCKSLQIIANHCKSLQIIANHCKSLQIIAIILLTSTEILHSQIQCGTPALTSQERSELITFIESLESRGPTPNTPVQIPIHLFVISDDNGNLMNNGKDYIKLTKEALVEATQLFDNGMEFFLCDITFLSNTTHYEMVALSEGVSLFDFIHTTLAYPHNAITAVVNKQGGRSYATGPEYPFPISIVRFPVNDVASGRIFAHELGHYFGLLHTYEASNLEVPFSGGAKFIGTPVFPDCSCNTLAPAVCSLSYICNPSIPDCNGTQNLVPCNCCNSGDLISDTPVDPGANVPPAFGPCEPTLTGSSPCNVSNKFVTGGDTLFQTLDYYPAYSNIMSGYDSAAIFSDEQKQRTLDILWHHDRRAFLIDSNQPSCNDYFVASSSGYVNRIFFNMQDQWEEEPIANITMLVTNNLISQTCNDGTDNNGRYTSIHPCFLNATDIDATVIQDQVFNEINNSIFVADNGVTTQDLVSITRHVLTITQLEKPYYWIAADANNSGMITTQDVIKVRKIVLGLEHSFDPVPSWRFMPLYYLNSQWNFVDNFNANPFTAELNYTGGTTRKYLAAGNTPSYLDRLDIVQFNEDIEESGTWSFVMMKTGDVNGSASIESIAPPHNDNLELQEVSHTCLDQSQTAAINIIAQDNSTAMSGYQLALTLDPDYLEIIGVNKGGISPFSQDYFNLSGLANGEIRSIWYDELAGGTVSLSQPKSLFQVYVKAKDEVCHIDQVIAIDSTAMPCDFYDGDGDSFTPGLSLTLTPQTIRNQLILVYPNPASNDINFQFRVNDQPAQVSIQIQDQNNNLIQHNDQYQPGTYVYSFSNLGSLQNGLLSYSILIGSDHFSGNAIKVQ